MWVTNSRTVLLLPLLLLSRNVFPCACSLPPPPPPARPAPHPHPCFAVLMCAWFFFSFVIFSLLNALEEEVGSRKTDHDEQISPP